MMTMLVKNTGLPPPKTRTKTTHPKPKKMSGCPDYPAPVILVSCTFAVVAVPCVSSLSLRRCRCRCAFSRGIYEEGCWSN